MAKSSYNKILENHTSPVWYNENDCMFHSYKILKEVTENYEDEYKEDGDRFFRIAYYDCRDIYQEQDVCELEILEETFMLHSDFEKVLEHLYGWLEEEDRVLVFNKLLPIFKMF